MPLLAACAAGLEWKPTGAGPSGDRCCCAPVCKGHERARALHRMGLPLPVRRPDAVFWLLRVLRRPRLRARILLRGGRQHHRRREARPMRHDGLAAPERREVRELDLGKTKPLEGVGRV